MNPNDNIDKIIKSQKISDKNTISNISSSNNTDNTRKIQLKKLEKIMKKL